MGAVQVLPFGTADEGTCGSFREIATQTISQVSGTSTKEAHLHVARAMLGDRDYADLALAYHDANKDGVIDAEELSASLAQWHASVGRLRYFFLALAEERKHGGCSEGRELRLNRRLAEIDALFVPLGGGESAGEAGGEAGKEDLWTHFEGIELNEDWETEREEDSGMFYIFGEEREALLFGPS